MAFWTEGGIPGTFFTRVKRLLRRGEDASETDPAPVGRRRRWTRTLFLAPLLIGLFLVSVVELGHPAAGKARRALGSAAQARALLDRAVAVARRHGSALVEAEALRARAEVLVELGERDAAEIDVVRALALFEDLGARADRDELRRWWEER